MSYSQSSSLHFPEQLNLKLLALLRWEQLHFLEMIGHLSRLFVVFGPPSVICTFSVGHFEILSLGGVILT